MIAALRPPMDRHCTTLASTLLAMLVAGCGGPGSLPPDEAPTPPGDTPDEPEEAAASTADHAVSAEGLTDLIEAPLGAGHGALLIRASFPGPTAEPAPCFQLDTMTDSTGAVWVPPAETHADWGEYCTTCAQRVSLGHGHGLFLFPNDGAPLPSADTVRFRISLRSCLTGLPLDPLFDPPPPPAVRVEIQRTPPSPDAARAEISLVFAFAPGAQFDAATAAVDPVLEAAVTAAGEALAEAELDILLLGSVDIGGSPVGDVHYSNGERAALDALDQGARAAAEAGRLDVRGALMVIFAPCLVRDDPLHGTASYPEGLVSRLPLGWPLPGHAEAIYLRASICDGPPGAAAWADGAPLGKVLAHEIGHALGLYHAVELDGRADHLPDTDEHNLMHPNPLLAQAWGLSPAQRRVLRRHPLVRFNP